MDLLTLTLLLLLNAPESPPAARMDLTAAIEAVLETPEAALIGELEQVIHTFEAGPQDVLADTALADELLRARVVLAWAQQDPERAAAAMDEAIRSAAGRELPLLGLGTQLKELAKQRSAALADAGTASIEVACAVPCQVIVNERRSVNPTDPLPFGTYRVWVAANEGNVEPMRASVELDQAGETERISFGGVEAPVPAGIETPESGRERGDRTQRDAAVKKPLLPLWVEIVGVVAGAGLIATGAGLLAIDGKCKGGGDSATCPILIENTAQGAALVAVGAGAMASFGAVLGVDQVRAGQNKRAARAMVSWTLRF